MKRITAILLLGIFSFNLFGYRLVASFLENQENKKMEIALEENNYSDKQLISIKQPTNLPYYNNSADFQRVDGEVEIEGTIYRFVKSRIYNDSLELLCLPNTGKMKIQAAKAGFSKMASDFQQTADSKKKQDSGNKSFAKTLSEFEEIQPIAYSARFNNSYLQNSRKDGSFVNLLFKLTPEQPPDTSCYFS